MGYQEARSCKKQLEQVIIVTFMIKGNLSFVCIFSFLHILVPELHYKVKMGVFSGCLDSEFIVLHHQFSGTYSIPSPTPGSPIPAFPPFKKLLLSKSLMLFLRKTKIKRPWERR